MHKLKIKIPIYNCECSIIFAEDIDELINRRLSKESMGELEGSVSGYMISPPNISKYYLYYRLSDTTINILCHEISHLVDHVLKDREVTWEGGEARAYLTGYISDKVFDFVLKKGLLINKWINNEKPSRSLRQDNKDSEGSQKELS